MERASKVIPTAYMVHPAEGCVIPVDFPTFTSKAEGAYFRDVDGNKYLIYGAYGPNVLDITT